VIRPYKNDGVCGFVLQRVFYPTEINSFADIGVSNTVGASDAEVDMAGMLIKSKLTKYDASKYTDKHGEDVRKAIKQKIDGDEITMPAATGAPAIMDLYAALKQSLDAQAAADKTAAAAPADKVAATG